MNRPAATRWIVAISVVSVFFAAQAVAQEGFDFETFGQLMQEAQVLYDAAQVLEDDAAEQKRSLLLESSEAQLQAIGMLHQALESDVFVGSDRDEAMVRLSELNIAVIVLLVETGSCGDAEGRLDEVLSQPQLLPEQGAQDLVALWSSVRDCEEYVAEAETPVEEPVEPTTQPSEVEPTEEEVSETEASSEHAEEVIVEPPRRPFRIPAFVTGTVSLASFATALAFYFNTQSLQDDLDAETDQPRFDPDEAESIWSDIERSDTLMNVFLWSGVALAAATAILVTLDLTWEDEALVIAPAVDLRGAYVGVNWLF